jgi:hypothetical protein
MEDDLKRRMIKGYFITPALRYPIGIAATGALLILINAADIGVAVILSGAAILATALRGDRATEEQVDAWFKEDLDMIEKRARERIYQSDDDRTMEKEPSRWHGPITQEAPGIHKNNILIKKGRDGRYRWTVSDVLIIFYRKHNIDCYKCHLDSLRSGLSTKEGVSPSRNLTPNEHFSRYFYRDVVSVSMGESESSKISVEGEKRSLLLQSLKISFVNSEVVVANVDVSESSGASSDVENSVRAVQKLIQEKKEGA